jgi:hypothetical protein
MFKCRGDGCKQCDTAAAEQWQYTGTSSAAAPASASDQAAVSGQWDSSWLRTVLRQPAFIKISCKQVGEWTGNPKTLTVRFCDSPHFLLTLLYIIYLIVYLHYFATEWAGIALIWLICIQEVCSSNPVWRLPVPTSFLVLLSTSICILRFIHIMTKVCLSFPVSPKSWVTETIYEPKYVTLGEAT